MRSKVISLLFISLLMMTTSSAFSADLENGKKLYKFCALCHGSVGQGTKGGDFPKIGGLPAWYQLHQMDLFVKEERFNPAMVTIGRMGTMTDKEKEDLSAYLESINIATAVSTLDIPLYKGDVAKGKEMFDEDCADCHGDRAEGNKRKDAPPTANQYSEYLLRQIDFFIAKERHHDNDPEDETFEDYSREDIIDILTYISTLDDK